MKSLLLTLSIVFCCLTSQAQSLTITNTTPCAWNIIITASAPNCGNSSVSKVYSVGPSQTIAFPTFTSVLWSGPMPAPFWVWDDVKIINPCATNISIGYGCSAGFNGIGVSTPQGCYPYVQTSCTDVTNCQGCSSVTAILSQPTPSDWLVTIP